MEPIICSLGDDTGELWDRFDRDGMCWIRMRGALELGLADPHHLITELLGEPPAAAIAHHRAASATDTKLRSEPHPYLPPAIQLQLCVRQASDPGGADLFLDAWQLLAHLRGTALHDQLFEAARIIRFPDLLWCAPTLSWRAGNLVCVHNGSPLATDHVGRDLQRVLQREGAVRFKLEPGDLLLSNNHRTLHATTAYTDPARHVVRILAWLPHPLAAPPELLAHAAEIAERYERAAHELAPWVRKRLGHGDYTRDDILGHDRGELAEDAAQQLQLVNAYTELVGSYVARRRSA